MWLLALLHCRFRDEVYFFTLRVTYHKRARGFKPQNEVQDIALQLAIRSDYSCITHGPRYGRDMQCDASTKVDEEEEDEEEEELPRNLAKVFSSSFGVVE